MRNKFQQGFTLIEILVVFGLMSFVSLAVATLINFQHREAKALEEKLAMQDVETEIENLISSTEYCGCLLKNYTVNASNPAAVSLNQNIASLPSGYTDPTTCAVQPFFAVPPVGQKLQASTLEVQSLGFFEGNQTSGAKYSGKIRVQFNPATMIRQLKPVEVSLSILVDPTGPLTALPVLSCGLGGSAGGQASCTAIGGTWNASTNQCSLSPPNGQANCEALGGYWNVNKCVLSGQILPASARRPCPDGFTSLGTTVNQVITNLSDGGTNLYTDTQLCMKN